LSDRIRDAYDGISQAVLDSEALVDLLLPCLRADFTAVTSGSPNGMCQPGARRHEGVTDRV